MKFSAAVAAIALAAPMASAVPFRMADFLAPMARAPAPAHEHVPEFPVPPPGNYTPGAPAKRHEPVPEFPVPGNFTPGVPAPAPPFAKRHEHPEFPVHPPGPNGTHPFPPPPPPPGHHDKRFFFPGLKPKPVFPVNPPNVTAPQPPHH